MKKGGKQSTNDAFRGKSPRRKNGGHNLVTTTRELTENKKSTTQLRGVQDREKTDVKQSGVARVEKKP